MFLSVCEKETISLCNCKVKLSKCNKIRAYMQPTKSRMQMQTYITEEDDRLKTKI